MSKIAAEEKTIVLLTRQKSSVLLHFAAEILQMTEKCAREAPAKVLLKLRLINYDDLVFGKNSDLIHEANRICDSKHVKAIKTIRITSISPFVEFFNEFDSSQNFKFVLLIRDPRGMLNSRLRISRIQKHETDKVNFQPFNNS